MLASYVDPREGRAPISDGGKRTGRSGHICGASAYDIRTRCWRFMKIGRFLSSNLRLTAGYEFVEAFGLVNLKQKKAAQLSNLDTGGGSFLRTTVAKTAVGSRLRKPPTIENSVSTIPDRLYELKQPKEHEVGSNLSRNFFILVILPTVLALIYFSIIKSSEYVAEARVVIRAPSEQKQSLLPSSLNLLSKIGGGGSDKSSIQDSYILVSYVKSRTIVEDIGGKNFMEKIFGGSSIDYTSRLPNDASIEDLWTYWKSQVSATVDTQSSIITLTARAYTSQESLELIQKIMKLSEGMVNTLSERSRGDALARAEREVQLARGKLAAARKDLLEYRNRSALINPVDKAKLIGDLIGKLTIKRFEIENALTSLSGALSPNSPSQRLQTSQLAAIDKQITDLKEQLTGDRTNPRVSAEIGEYEQLKLTELFSERLYDIARTTYEKARQDISKQQLYLETIVRPNLPEYALYPKTGVDTALFFAIATIFWGIGSLIVASVKDHML